VNPQVRMGERRRGDCYCLRFPSAQSPRLHQFGDFGTLTCFEGLALVFVLGNEVLRVEDCYDMLHGKKDTRRSELALVL
jgi:hypothetical protein